MTEADWIGIKHFKPDEFRHPELLRPRMARMVDNLRELFGAPLVVSSSWRVATHGDTKDSAHLADPVDGFYSGIDLTTPRNRISGAERWRLDALAKRVGFVRIGHYPKHIHLDIETRLPQAVLWVGTD